MVYIFYIHVYEKFITSGACASNQALAKNVTLKSKSVIIYLHPPIQIQKFATKLHKSCSPIVFTIILFFQEKKMFKTSFLLFKKKISNARVANYEQFLPTDLIASASYINKQRKAMKAYV